MHPPTALLLATGPESNAREITAYGDVQAPRSIPNFDLLLDDGIMRVRIINPGRSPHVEDDIALW